MSTTPSPTDRRGRARRLGLVLTAWAFVTTTLTFAASRSSLAWNHTDSIPMGLYRIAPLLHDPRRGELVALALPDSVSTIVAARHYLQPSEKLFKAIVAIPGDHVCLDGAAYRVNGTTVGPILATDLLARPLPTFNFCGIVPPGYFWTGTSAPRSFDSRYFGPVPRFALTHSLEPEWTF